MFDIRFYQDTFALNQKIMKAHSHSPGELLAEYEAVRHLEPVVYNIETTNACNMRCKMCPRTTMMTRNVETLEPALFRDIIDQLRPWTAEEWKQWEEFVFQTYGAPLDSKSENHFFLYIIPKVIQLHGYGEPLLDRNMPNYVQLLTDQGLSSYFSCNPANIN